MLIVDLRSLSPIDKETIFSSVRKTGKLLVVYEACKTMGFGAEIVSLVAEEGIDARIKRVAGMNTPIPYSKPLEKQAIPSVDVIVSQALSFLEKEPVG